MSKSASLKLKHTLSETQFIEQLDEYFFGKNSSGEYLLKYKNKWVWCFYPGEEERNADLQFSSAFTIDERESFLNVITKNLDSEIEGKEI